MEPASAVARALREAPLEGLEALIEAIEEAYEDLEVDAHRGGQPLYPIILSVE